MTHEDIPLPPAVRRIVDLLLATVVCGLRTLIRQHGAPERAWCANRAPPGLATALRQARRLHRILRYVFVILATHFTPIPRKQAVPAANRHWERRAVTDDPATWRMTFTTSRPYRVFGEDLRPSPFTGAERRPSLTLARKVEGLRRALADPMRHVRRLSRLLRATTTFIAWRPPKRPPPPERRDFWEEQIAAWAQARFDLRRLNTS